MENLIPIKLQDKSRLTVRRNLKFNQSYDIDIWRKNLQLYLSMVAL